MQRLKHIELLTEEEEEANTSKANYQTTLNLQNSFTNSNHGNTLKFKREQHLD